MDVFVAVVITFIGYSLACFALIPEGVMSAIWPFFLAVVTPSVVSWIAGFVANLTRRLFDRPGLAGLPMDGEDWANERMNELDLGDHEVVVTEHCDAYDPEDRRILLSENTAREHTVRAWATAAHELGHAVIRSRWPVLGLVLTVCRAYWLLFFHAGMALCAGGVILGFEPAVGAAQMTWIIGSVLACGQLLDELAASLVALRLLGRFDTLSRRQKISSGVFLAIMFGTYVTMNAVLMAFLAASDRIAGMIGPGLIEGSAAPVAGWRVAVILLLSLLALVTLIDVAVDLVRRRTPTLDLLTWAGLVMPFSLLLTWDQPAVLEHPWLILLAFIPTFEIIGTPVRLAASAAGRFVARLGRAIAPRSTWCDTRVHWTPRQSVTDPVSARSVLRPRVVTRNGLISLAELVHFSLFLPLLWFLLW